MWLARLVDLFAPGNTSVQTPSYFGSQAYCFSERRMRMNGFADINCIGAHLDRRTGSPIMSPACGPTITPPMIR
jgi:hypothetical protein